MPGPPPGDLPDPGIEPTSQMSLALADGFFTTSASCCNSEVHYTQYSLQGLPDLATDLSSLPVSAPCSASGTLNRILYAFLMKHNPFFAYATNFPTHYHTVLILYQNCSLVISHDPLSFHLQKPSSSVLSSLLPSPIKPCF